MFHNTTNDNRFDVYVLYVNATSLFDDFNLLSFAKSALFLQVQITSPRRVTDIRIPAEEPIYHYTTTKSDDNPPPVRGVLSKEPFPSGWDVVGSLNPGAASHLLKPLSLRCKCHPETEENRCN